MWHHISICQTINLNLYKQIIAIINAPKVLILKCFFNLLFNLFLISCREHSLHFTNLTFHILDSPYHFSFYHKFPPKHEISHWSTSKHYFLLYRSAATKHSHISPTLTSQCILYCRRAPSLRSYHSFSWGALRWMCSSMVYIVWMRLCLVVNGYAELLRNFNAILLSENACGFARAHDNRH